jgi:hypothetical protein
MGVEGRTLGKMRNAYKSFVRKSKRLYIIMCKIQSQIKDKFSLEIGCEVKDWIHLAQDRN